MSRQVSCSHSNIPHPKKADNLSRFGIRQDWNKSEPSLPLFYNKWMETIQHLLTLSTIAYVFARNTFEYLLKYFDSLLFSSRFLLFQVFICGVFNTQLSL